MPRMGLRFRRVLAVTLLAAATTFSAQSVATAAPPSRVSLQDGTLGFFAMPGAVNDLTVTASADAVVIRDTVTSLSAGLPCKLIAPNAASCPATGVRALALSLGDRDDRVRNDTAIDAELLGGDGNDLMFGGLGADLFDGGNGIDTVSYEHRLEPISATIDGEANDGGSFRYLIVQKCTALSSEHDSIGSRNENLKATEGGDNLGGTVNGELLQGGGGNDTICGAGGDDTLEGGNGSDTLRGGSGNDHLFGEADNDKLYGGTGNDDGDGGAGTDVCDVESPVACP